MKLRVGGLRSEGSFRGKRKLKTAYERSDYPEVMYLMKRGGKNVISGVSKEARTALGKSYRTRLN